MPGYLVAIDQGTTGSTVVVLSDRAELLGRATRELQQHFPQPGWVEHDLEEIWATVVGALGDALSTAGVRPEDCLGIGITNQRETTVLWDRASGVAVHRAIVWQDRRTTARCRELKAAGLEDLFRARTGLLLDPYFSGTKLEWLLDAVPDARARADRGELAFGTIDSWLVYRLSKGAAHVTDVSNASRTLLYDIRRGVWDDELLRHLRVPASVLPRVRDCAEQYAHTKEVPGLPDGIPIAGMAGDQQAALFGQTCFDVGDAKCTYGTGAFLLVNTGVEAKVPPPGLLTTVAWRLSGITTYALEGSAFIAGAAVQWLRDGLGIIRAAAESETLAARVASSGDVTFVPALAGLGAPYWDPDARGLLCGLSRDTTAAHIARATLEGIAFQIEDLAQAMSAGGGKLAKLRVDGGASENNLLMQFQADLLDVEVDRPVHTETTALGAAYLAGLAVNVFPDLRGILQTHKIGRTFKPQMNASERHAHLDRWHRAVARTRSEPRAS